MKKAIALRQAVFEYQGLDIACNLCSSDNHKLITIRDRDGYRSFKVLCRDCGLIYSNPIPSHEEMKLYYAHKLHLKRGEIFLPKLRRIYRAAIRAMYRFNRIKHYLYPGAKVLDTSACMGEFVYLLRNKGCDAIGVEYNPDFINYAYREFGISLVNQFLDEINISPSSFDIITAHHILNLSLNPYQMLKKYHSFLKQEGILNIEVPNIEARHTAPFNRFRFKHFYNFNLYTIEKLAQKAGFNLVNTIIIPESMHINMILRKGEERHLYVQSVPNYHTVRNSVKGYKSLNYLASPFPYLKFLNNMKKFVKLNTIIKSYSGGKEILDACCTKIAPLCFMNDR